MQTFPTCEETYLPSSRPNMQQNLSNAVPYNPPKLGFAECLDMNEIR